MDVMKRIALALSMVLLSGAAFAGSLKDEYSDKNGMILQALAANDMRAFEKIMRPMITKDYTYVEMGQKMTFDQMVANMKMGMGMMKKPIKAMGKILSVKETGNTGVIMEMQGMSGMMMGEDKKPHKMEYTGQARMDMVKIKGKWFLKTMTVLKSSMKMDGKEMPMGGAPK